jgi:hypothetical protein
VHSQKPTTGPFLSHISLVHTTPSSVRSIIILFIHQNLSPSSGLVSSGFPTNILSRNVRLLLPASYPSRLILLDVFILIILGENYKL